MLERYFFHESAISGRLMTEDINFITYAIHRRIVKIRGSADAFMQIISCRFTTYYDDKN